MKRLLLSAVVLSSIGSYAQVGINTTEPKEMLDVQGNIILGKNDWTTLTLDGKDENDWTFNAHSDGQSFHLRTQKDGEDPKSFYHTTFTRDGRVGIGVTSPNASLEVAKRNDMPETQPQGVIFPKFSTAERSKFENTTEGLMIYNTTKKCIEMYQGVVNGVHQWQCLPDAGSAQSQSVAVSPAGFKGSYVSGVALTNANKVNFTLTNNGFNSINNVNFSEAVRIENGAGDVRVKSGQNNSISLNGGESRTLSYTLEGTPQEGNITAYFDKLGLQADQSTQVGLGSATITDKQQYTVSLKNNNVEVIQGKINNTDNKVTVQIPYTNGKGGYNAVSVAQTTAQGQNGDTNPLTLTIPAGTFGVNGTLTATIEVGGDQEYKVRQLEPGQEYVIATFPVNMNGTQYNVALKGIGGILDKHFDDPDHKFVYIPIEVTGMVDGQPYNETWLNLNLGADYANITKTGIFNPGIKPEQISKTDHHAYGSLFQFGRDGDGHELVNWSSSTSGARAKNNIRWKGNSELSYSSQSDPCPNGYHTPTNAEWMKFHKLITGTDSSSSSSKMWLARKLDLPAAGYRYYSSGASFRDTGSSGYYWSSSSNGSYGAWSMYFYSSYSSPQYSYYRSRGFSVRCLKD